MIDGEAEHSPSPPKKQGSSGSQSEGLQGWVPLEPFVSVPYMGRTCQHEPTTRCRTKGCVVFFAGMPKDRFQVVFWGFLETPFPEEIMVMM